MAEDLRINMATANPFVVTAWNGNANAFGEACTKEDLGNPMPFELTIKLEITGIATGTGNVDLYAMWSDDDTDYPTTAEGTMNLSAIGSMKLNGTTLTRKFFSLPVRARYLNLYLYNDSGKTLGASGNAAEWIGLSIDQV
jgi:hypothetical protein